MTSVAEADRRTGLRPSRRGSSFYLLLPVLMVALAVVGFWPQYYGRLMSGTALDPGARHVLVHVHSTLFLGWIAIIFIQAALVRAGRPGLHRRLGPLLAVYGYAAAGIGLFAGITLAAYRVTRGGTLDGAAVFVAAPILDMMMFAGFLTAALAYRRRPEIHKRMIVLTGYSFAFIGLVRYLVRMPGVMDDVWIGTALLIAPILLCMLWELATSRRIHPAWLFGLAAFTARLLLELLAGQAAWLPIGRAIVRPFV